MIELDPSKVSPQTHQFIGMFRPVFVPFEEGSSVCPCRQAFCLTKDKMDHWLAGHFDIPQYRVIEEAVGDYVGKHPIEDVPKESVSEAMRAAINKGVRKFTLTPEAYDRFRGEHDPYYIAGGEREEMRFYNCPVLCEEPHEDLSTPRDEMLTPTGRRDYVP